MSFLAYTTGIAFLIWIILPLFKKDSTWVSLYMEADELADKKKRVYGNIADLEFDFAMGRLSEKDFKHIRQAFLSEAGRVIEKLESQKSSAFMDRIENDISNLGKKRKTKKKNKNRSKVFCIECGTENLPEAKFCMKCGKEMS
ncbi:MAG: zinc ribbon domain-containing protein [Candidatus Marinimicrobia bacterium]|jgi:ribosomal protein L40E|nr:zinc ribbon domain-containing protein [Candidatus Neomarinimicrobiota bacterium]MBT3630365.1 zinc ribbon domain-containing protein [Candidatus Neomarinimicrobiota bacterium]MBT3823685.1 zinc ribbon domain-containing protein [Candidatus Neomarinimicrobiota bacterium]MBT4131967.1 zinc ribbon domain-containing protein [Candidatus Neomarinimicrobiota bacterium]MBT4294692.1 zinc ribbon domain-containing protein [Candidatus Neomarinimicrobiota bacterium]